MRKLHCYTRLARAGLVSFGGHNELFYFLTLWRWLRATWRPLRHPVAALRSVNGTGCFCHFKRKRNACHYQLTMDWHSSSFFAFLFFYSFFFCFFFFYLIIFLFFFRLVLLFQLFDLFIARFYRHSTVWSNLILIYWVKFQWTIVIPWVIDLNWSRINMFSYYLC